MHKLQVESNGSSQATTRSSRALNDEIRPFTDAKSQKFRRDVAEGKRPWGIGCDGDMCARQSAHQKRNDYFNSFLSLYPRADRHSQVIAAEALMSYELKILPRCVG